MQSRSRRNFSPLSWHEFFDEKRSLAVGESVFNVYQKGANGILFLLLHGGGYSGLTWACLTEEITQILDCQVIAPDLRGHGDTTTSDDYQLDAETQVQDVAEILDHLYGSDQPPTILVGHSMGGALAVRVAASGCLTRLVSLMVIDVVEGSAMDALHGMQTFLNNRPQGFLSLEDAVSWCVRSGTVRNVRSARVSMPAQLKLCLAKDSSSRTKATICDSLTEESEDTTSSGTEEKSAQTAFEWRLDLARTEPYWKGWFSGLSQLFLSIPVPKILLLAGPDRLDKDLTVGQMQGKFQMLILPKVGHCVHEDSPLKVAEALAGFCVRHKLAEAKIEFKPVYPGC